MPVRLWLVAICVAGAGAFPHLAASTDLVPAARLSTLPLAIGDWRGKDDGPLDRDTERTLQADAYTLRTYERGSAALGLFVAYYATQRAGRAIHSPLNCLPGTGWEWLDRGRQQLTVDGRTIEVNTALAQKDATTLRLYYWYQSRGRVVASEYRNRLLLVRDALTEHRSDGALVRVVAPVARGLDRSADALAFIRALHPVLSRHLPE
jgi:EpsI family protein